MIKIPSFTNQIIFESFFRSNQHFWCLSPPETLKYELEKRFIVILNSTIKLKKLKLGEGFLQYSDNKYIDINNIHMQYVNHIQIEQQGFKLTRMDQTLEIYGDIEEWVEYLKHYAVQFYFQQRFIILRKIEKGTLQNWYSVKCKKHHVDMSAIIIEKNNQLNRDAIINNINLLRKFKFNLLPKLRELYESRDQIFIVFDNIEGTFIDDIKLDKQLNEQDISTIMRILFTILEFLHLNNITLNNKGTVENLFLRDSKDWTSVYFLDVFDVQQVYENNAQFYEKAREDVQNLGNIMKYLLDYNIEGAKLYNYELIEWSKLAFDFYQKINDSEHAYSSYDALHHPFIHHGSNYFFPPSNHSRRLFHQSSIGLKQLETSTEQNSFQSHSQSPQKKNRIIARNPQIQSNPITGRKSSQEDNSSRGSIDIFTILEKYSSVQTCDLIIEPNNINSQKRRTIKQFTQITQLSNFRNDSKNKISNQSLHNFNVPDKKFTIKKKTNIQFSNRNQTLNLLQSKKNSAEL